MLLGLSIETDLGCGFHVSCELEHRISPVKGRQPLLVSPHLSLLWVTCNYSCHVAWPPSTSAVSQRLLWEHHGHLLGLCAGHLPASGIEFLGESPPPMTDRMCSINVLWHPYFLVGWLSVPNQQGLVLGLALRATQMEAKFHNDFLFLFERIFKICPLAISYMYTMKFDDIYSSTSSPGLPICPPFYMWEGLKKKESSIGEPPLFTAIVP